jgi:hypothetical protein
MEHKFERTICNNSIFKVKKIETADIEVLKAYDVRNWDDSNLNYEMKIKHGKWVVNDEKDIFLISIGGGSCEVPKMYSFGFKGKKYKYEFGGGGDDADIYEKLENGNYNQKMVQTRYSSANDTEEIQKYFLEAMAVMTYESKWVNNLTICLNSPVRPLTKEEKEKIDNMINEIKASIIMNQNKNETLLDKIRSFFKKI